MRRPFSWIICWRLRIFSYLSLDYRTPSSYDLRHGPAFEKRLRTASRHSCRACASCRPTSPHRTLSRHYLRPVPSLKQSRQAIATGTGWITPSYRKATATGSWFGIVLSQEELLDPTACFCSCARFAPDSEERQSEFKSYLEKDFGKA